MTFCVLLGWGNVQVFSQPANDDKADAQVITGASGQVTGSTVGATKEIGEASHGGSSGGASVWFQWRAPDAGEVTFNTSGSSFDTLLAVYEGATLVAENDDDDTLQSAVRFSASQGHAYLIAVDGYGGDTGSYVLNWRLGESTSTPTDPTPPTTLAEALAALADAQATLETLEGLTHGLVAMLEALLQGQSGDDGDGISQYMYDALQAEYARASAEYARASAERDAALAARAYAEAAQAQAVAERDAFIAAYEQQIAELQAAAEAAYAQVVAERNAAQAAQLHAEAALTACEEAHVQAVAERNAAQTAQMYAEAGWKAAEEALAACQAGQL